VSNEDENPYSRLVGALGKLTGLFAGLVAGIYFTGGFCLADGGDASGVLIGETGSRTYLGDRSSEHPRRIISIPLARVEQVLVGGREGQLDQISCGPRPQ
jgi:hypothetical protein